MLPIVGTIAIVSQEICESLLLFQRGILIDCLSQCVLWIHAGSTACSHSRKAVCYKHPSKDDSLGDLNDVQCP